MFTESKAREEAANATRKEDMREEAENRAAGAKGAGKKRPMIQELD